jgi:cellulose synthase/poly-beta-1,6-N-acetylglucosamine synthase-like glycosyltransferase
VTAVDVANLVAAAINGVIAIPAAIFSLEIAAALPSQKKPQETWDKINRPPIAVLVPAHNEKDTIESSLRALKLQLRPFDRLLVVADNCTDETAMLARRAGAEVIERHDLVNRGKGFALDYGVAHLASNPPPVVVIVDADVRPADGALDRLAEQAARTGKPTQGVYLLRQAAQGAQNPISMLAFQVRNHVRPLGLSRLGGPSPLFGAGMAFPWTVIANAPLASPHLTEDVALALDLAAQGHTPKLCADALIEGESAPTDTAAVKQRRRWEHGHLSLICSAAPKTLWKGLTHGRFGAIALAMDVMVPPLSLLLMLVSTATVLTWAGEAFGLLSLNLALAQSAVFVILMTALLTAAIRFSPSGARGKQLLAMARYAAGKLPIYAAFLFKRQKTWERTDRAPVPPTPVPPSHPKKVA